MARKVVQTELEEKEYRLLKEAVDKHGLSLKRGVREAVLQWVSTQIPVSEVPLFKLKPVRTGVETDSSKLDERLYREKRD